MKSGETTGLLKRTTSSWLNDNAFELGAAIAYYTLFSLAPVLVIAIVVAGAVFGREAAQGQIAQQLQTVLGPQGANAVQSMIQGTQHARGSGVAAIVGVIILLVGATGVFSELKTALNKVWEVPPQQQKSGVSGTVKSRALAFLLVLGIGILLLVLQIGSMVISALGKVLPNIGGLTHVLLRSGDIVLSVVVMGLLFAAIFKLLPDCKVAWSDVWVGALVTAVLFTLGRIGIGLYLSRGAVASAYGAAGSVVIILLGIYYSALIFLFGAEFTRAYADLKGSRCGQRAGEKKGERLSGQAPGQPAKQQQAAGRPASGRAPVHASHPEEYETMQSETDYLNTEAAAAKAAMRRTMEELKASMRGAASPAGWTRDYPWIAVGIATAAGLAVGGLLWKERARRKAASEQWADRLKAAWRSGSEELRGTHKEPDRERRGIMGAVTAGAAALVAQAIKTSLQTAITSAVSAKAASSASGSQGER